MHFFRLIVKPESGEVVAANATGMLRAEAVLQDIAASRSMLSPA